MSLLRFFISIVVLGSLVLLTVQNWFTPMQLVFLGMRSPMFPLPVWVLSSIVIGGITTVVLSTLFRLTGFTARRAATRTKAGGSTSSSSYTYNSPYTQSSVSDSPRTAWKAANPSTSQSNRSNFDRDDDEDDASDWFDDNSDWNDEPQDSRSRRTDFEKRQEPKSGSRSGSNYSYNYRDPAPSNPPADVDADYRVIIPPTRSLDDDDFEDTPKR